MMSNMKKLVFPLLGIVMFGLSACIKSGDNSQNFNEVPAVVGFAFEEFSKTINISDGYTSYWPLLAPELMSAELDDGDAIIANFTINYDQQSPSSKYFTVSNLTWKKVERDYPKPKNDAGEGFDEPIVEILQWGRISYGWNDYLFFKFKQTAPKDVVFIYEMTYDSDVSSLPTIYLRAKKLGTGSSPSAANSFFFAFNIKEYLSMLHEDSENNVKFYVEYKTGVDKDGNDVFKLWSGGNPLIIPKGSDE